MVRKKRGGGLQKKEKTGLQRLWKGSKDPGLSEKKGVGKSSFKWARGEKRLC